MAFKFGALQFFFVLLHKVTGFITSLALKACHFIATEDIITFKKKIEKLKRPRVHSNLRYSVTNGHS
jgi:hypothetical protein